MSRAESIEACLRAASPVQELAIEDQSHRHRGHAGAADGRGHFRVRLVSSAFAGQPALARHRAVHAALADLLRTDIHALALDLRAPDEAAAGNRGRP
ncbi:MAG: BolA family transcriptional regulator [Xanthomonadales bacterium]|nr:BolA family transcriptional regulator [Xanthomonadales bacterium]